MKQNSQGFIPDKVVYLVVGLMLLIVASPWLVGLMRQQPGYIYTGLTGNKNSNWSDQLVYFSWINQAREGRWLFENLFTNEAQQPSFFHPLWLLLGWIAEIFSISTPTIFHLARLLLAGIFLLTIYSFIGYLSLTRWKRLFIFLLIGLGAGWGWLFYVLNLSQDITSVDIAVRIFPIDIYHTEFFILRSMWHSPLTILSQLLLLVIFWYFLVNYQNFHWRRFVIIGVIISFLALVHPYDIFTVFGVLFIFFILRFLQSRRLEWQSWLQVVGWGLFVIPVVIYFIWLFTTQPAFVGWWY